MEYMQKLLFFAKLIILYGVHGVHRELDIEFELISEKNISII